MEKTLDTQGTNVSRYIEVHPDKLIELGHRMKASAMDSCAIGESVTARFTDSITLIFHPEKEYTKPVHKPGPVGTYGTAFYVENLDEVVLK